MISQANIDWISKVSGVSAEEISGALSKDEEVSLDLKLNGKVYTPEEIEEKTKANQDAYIEIGYKKVAQEAGIDLSKVEKSPSKIVGAIKSGVEGTLEEKYKNMTPSEELAKVMKDAESWKEKYQDLNKTHESVSSKLKEETERYKNLESNIKTKERDNRILASFPEKMKMDRNDALLIFNNNHEFVEAEDGYEIKSRDGKLKMDGLGNPEKLDNVVKSFVESKGWTKSSGKGGDDQDKGGGNPKGLSYEEAIKYIESKSIEPMSAEGSKIFAEITQK